ncbi:MAG: hypothetical protein LBD58_13520 [Treponema sp.]|jgi:predicted transposase YbfD/YdcC|nr:hypothetical protein [Treponema sp.]
MTATAEEFAVMLRGYCSVENKLHWFLDVSLREAASQVRKDSGLENLNILRKMERGELGRPAFLTAS